MLAIIQRLFKKMLIGIKFSSIKVCGDLIIDGHHRYLASRLAKFNLENVTTLKPSSIEVIDWISIEYTDIDWDTPAKIKMLNEEDARFNNMTSDELCQRIR